MKKSVPIRIHWELTMTDESFEESCQCYDFNSLETAVNMIGMIEKSTNHLRYTIELTRCVDCIEEEVPDSEI